MARFVYNGEKHREFVTKYGETLKIRVRGKDGAICELTPTPPATSFIPGEDIGHEIEDERVIRHLSKDPRFTRVL